MHWLRAADARGIQPHGHASVWPVSTAFAVAPTVAKEGFASVEFGVYVSDQRAASILAVTSATALAVNPASCWNRADDSSGRSTDSGEFAPGS